MGEARRRRATEERHESLLTLLRGGVDGVETLAERVGVSTSTVRRDLTSLQRDGRIARTYGGAMVRDAFHERSFGRAPCCTPRPRRRSPWLRRSTCPRRAMSSSTPGPPAWRSPGSSPTGAR
ncbi:DeoR family transcriptional regulator [Blastococcus brunescens]|uniref:DeoR family transcriptional regulator n=1 Tax=Blastococcus brunescens TaxID=1564165 RepID=A0ABZ1B606_9ACTN|nr:DeoR family transcriptional regulator [Blastococcus sp. BMG 8361]WRL65288.1 DeoR family transcriptional regulator [Blastococcus sp. BMG 8361]